MAATVPAMHIGPWTERDLRALPEDGQRHELVEGSLIVSPPPAGGHQLAASELEFLMRAAAPSQLVVVQALGVRMLGGSVLVPDLLVAERAAVKQARSGILDADRVQLVVEIVSPSSVTMDRVTKPQLYAQAWIPSFWRIELEQGEPRIEVYRLRGRDYVGEGWASAGEELVVEEPFPFSFDPARLA